MKALRALISAGSNVNASEDKFRGNTPLHWATLHKKTDAVQILLQAGADPTRRNGEGLSSLDIARDLRLSEVVKWMEETPKGRVEAESRAAQEEKAREFEAEQQARAQAATRVSQTLSSMRAVPTAEELRDEAEARQAQQQAKQAIAAARTRAAEDEQARVAREPASLPLGVLSQVFQEI